MPDRDKVMNGLEVCIDRKPGKYTCNNCPYEIDGNNCEVNMSKDALSLLKEQEARIKKYEYVFDFLGIGFREWATKILDGEAEAICEADEHKHKTVITFKLI